MGADRLPALEAVAEAARAFLETWLADSTFGYQKKDADKLSDALDRLDATPAAQSPTPTPTDEELATIFTKAATTVSMYSTNESEAHGNRALYNAGAAAERERIRVAFANCDAHCRSRMAQDIIDNVPRVNDLEDP